MARPVGSGKGILKIPRTHALKKEIVTHMVAQIKKRRLPSNMLQSFFNIDKSSVHRLINLELDEFGLERILDYCEILDLQVNISIEKK